MTKRYIKHEGDKWNVYSEEGKLLGSHPTKESAEKQLEAVEAHKHGANSYLPSLEVRSIETEVRMVEEGGKRLIRGYAAVFNSRSQVMDTDENARPFREFIRPGAFTRSLAEADVRGLYNHDSKRLLGRRMSGTLRLVEDERGLRYEIDPPDTPTGREVVALLERGDLTGSSFGFAAIDDNWTLDENGMDLRELRAVHLFDVGPCTFPAYREASAAYRSLDAHRAKSRPTITIPTARQTEILLRLRQAAF